MLYFFVHCEWNYSPTGMEELLRKFDLLLDKQERIIEELFRHSHQQDLLLTEQERTNALLSDLKSQFVPSDSPAKSTKNSRKGG